MLLDSVVVLPYKSIPTAFGSYLALKFPRIESRLVRVIQTVLQSLPFAFDTVYAQFSGVQCHLLQAILPRHHRNLCAIAAQLESHLLMI